MSERPRQSQVAGALRHLADIHEDDDGDISAERLRAWADTIEKADAGLWALLMGFPMAVRLHQMEQRGTLDSIRDELERSHSAGLRASRVFDHLDADEAGRKYADARLAELEPS